MDPINAIKAILIMSILAFFHETSKGISVLVPDLPYGMTCSKDFDEAERMAVGS